MSLLTRTPARCLLALALVACSAAPEDDLDVAHTSTELKSACAPSEKVFGIDIASYQHPNGAAIDWKTVAQHEKFVIIKATESTGYTNPYYANDARQARAAGLIVGAYHYLRYKTDGRAQAEHFLDTIGRTVPDGDLPPMLDVEDTSDPATAAQRVAIMKTWLDRVEAVTGRKPMIYSGAWYWSGSYLGSPSGYSDHPLVWAAYPNDQNAVNTGTYCPKIPDDFSRLTIWQFAGGEGRTPGIPAACDQDVFYGTLDDLRQLTRGTPAPSPAAAAYAGKSLGVGGQSYPVAAAGAVTVEVGQTVTGWVDLKNTGSKTWQPGSVWMAPIPRDRASPLQAASWLAPHRISSVAAPVAPGGVGRFALDLTGREVGETTLSLGWVAEGETWFADGPLGAGPADGYFAVRVQVVPAKGGSSASGGSASGGSSSASGGSSSASGGSSGSTDPTEEPWTTTGAAGAGSVPAAGSDEAAGATSWTGDDEPTPEQRSGTMRGSTVREDDGCSVAGAGAAGSTWWLLGLVGLGAARRRRASAARAVRGAR